MSTTLSPNMNLPVPGVGTEPGPDWATDINNCLSILDQHNHSSGSGVQINPGGININTDFPMNGNNLTTIRSLRLSPQSSPLSLAADVGCLYESGVDLYYNDANGNQIQITSGGGVAGSPGSIGSLTAPASATYSAGSKSFIWQSGVSKAAAMDNGAITIRETDVTSANGITIVSPTALGANYQLTLMGALPAQQNVMTVDNTGAVSNVTWNDVANNRTRATGTTVSVGGVAISGSSGGFSTSSTTYVDVTNLSVTITTSGRPVQVGLIGDGSINGNQIVISGAAISPNNDLAGAIKIVRGVTDIDIMNLAHSGFANGSICGTGIPGSAIQFIDVVAAGTYTYKIQIAIPTAINISSSAINANFVKLAAYEL